MPEVSILMTIYNVAPFVATAVASIQQQTFTDWELIIIDDGSTDQTWPIVSDQAGRDKRITAIRNEQNLGTAGALNKGLALAQGDFITRQDGDDISEPGRLAAQLDFLRQHTDIGAVGTAVTLIDDTGQQLGQTQYPQHDQQIQETLLDHMCFCGPTVMARRDIFVAAGLYFNNDLSYSEDYDLCLRLAEAGKLANLDQPLYQYRQHAHSVSHSRRYQQIRRKVEALAHALNRRYHAQIPQPMRYLLASDYLRAAIIAYRSDELDGACACLKLALDFYPQLLHKGQPLETMMLRYTHDLSIEAALVFIQAIFTDLLPGTRYMFLSQRRLLAQLHITELFSGLEQGDSRQTQKHLWSAIQQNPTWLLNRGVLSLSLKSVFRLI
jgi:glycosyltransferase involved in cell wall biosynthesis